MAEQQDTIATGMQRWLAYVQEYHIDAWRDERVQLGSDTMDAWLGAVWDDWQVAEASQMPTHLTALTDFTQQLTQMNDRREREDVAIPDGAHLNYYAWEAGRQEELRADETAWAHLGQTFEPEYAQQYTDMEMYSHVSAIEVDTSGQPDLFFAEQLELLGARLDALSHDEDGLQQHGDQSEGMSY